MSENESISSSQGTSLRLAYLTSEYPAVSHTFILREIQELRKQSIDVYTASVNPSRNLDNMAPEEIAESRATLYIKNSSLLQLLSAHVYLALCSPLRYYRMIRKACSIVLNWPVKRSKVFAYFMGAGVLLKWMRLKGVQHIHVHFTDSAASAALIAASGGSITYSLSIHGPVEFYNIDKEFLQEKAQQAQFIRCISYFCQSQVMTVLPPDQWSKLHIVHCGVDPDQYAPRPNPENDTPVMLCVGRLVALKGQYLLLQACKRLRAQGVRFNLFFVGDGPERKPLESYCRELQLDDVVTFTGPIGQDKIHTYYDKADIFVLPSFAEGVPVVLMEAMAKEIACLSTYVGGIRELIRSNQNGILIAPSDIDTLTKTLKELLTDSKLRNRLGAEGRKTVEQEFNNGRNGCLMADLFNRYLKEQSR